MLPNTHDGFCCSLRDYTSFNFNSPADKATGLARQGPPHKVDVVTIEGRSNSIMRNINNHIGRTGSAPNSYVLIWILRCLYGHTHTTRHYTEARFRPQAQ